MGKKSRNRLASIIIILILLALFLNLFIGQWLISPQNRKINAPPTGLILEPVIIQNDVSPPVSGWFVPGKKQKGGILLLHSNRSDRTSMLARAKFLNQAGYSLLLIDLYAHGESPGDYISFGYYESHSAHQAFSYLKSRLSNQSIGVIGFSLGGAASLLGEKPIAADAIVLEAVYSRIETAVENRLAIRLGKLGRYLEPFLTWQLYPRLGISTQQLAPIDAIKQLKSPLLLIAGAKDKRTLAQESEQLFQAASQPKSFWLIPEAHHEDFHRHSPRQYEAKVLTFFNQYLDTHKSL